MSWPEAVELSCTNRVPQLTLLAPEIVEAILDGRQPEGMRLEDLLDAWSVEWQGQRRQLAVSCPRAL